MRYYIVDAFTDKVFHGNQAGVCLLEKELPDELMQSIAAENNLSETAFVIKREGEYYLRWFTPEVEIDLCGHATLATAAVILTEIEPGLQSVSFHTMSGVLTVEKNGDWFTMYFPTRAPKTVEIPELLEKGMIVELTIPKEKEARSGIYVQTAPSAYREDIGLDVFGEGLKNEDFIS